MAKMIDCPYCGKLTDPKLSSCPHCGGVVQQQKSAPKRLDMGKGRQTCPSCKALVQDGDIICVTCGTNLLTGQKVSEGAKQVQEPAAGGERPPWLLPGAGAAVLVLFVAILWIFVMNADPKTKAMRLIEEAKYLEAMDLLSEYVEDVPDDEQAMYELGRLQWRANLPAAAAQSFESAVRLNPGNVGAAYWAIASLARGGGDETQRQQRLLERIVKARPNDPAGLYLLSLLQAAQGDTEGQRESLEKLADISPDDATVQWGLGLTLAIQGDYEAADREFATVDTPERAADVYATRGILASLQGNEADSLALLEQAVETPGLTIEGQCLTQLGKLYIADGRFADAEKILTKARALDRTNDLTRYLLLLSMEAQGRQPEALRELEAMVNLRGPYAEDAGIAAARIYLRKNDISSASNILNQAGGGTEKSPEYLVLRGRIAVAQNNNRGALDSFQRAIQADPAYPSAYMERGLLLVSMDRIDEGIRDLEHYVRLLGADITGTRVYDMRALISQLRRSTNSS